MQVNKLTPLEKHPKVTLLVNLRVMMLFISAPADVKVSTRLGNLMIYVLEQPVLTA